MSRILKRPMFRIGGSANDGIVSLATPRRNYEEGSDIMRQAEADRKLLEQFAGPGRDLRNRQMDLLLEGSLALGAGAGAGKKLPQALALAFKEPAQRFIKSSQEEEAIQRQLRLAAATGALKKRDERELLKLKYGMEAGKEQEQRQKELMAQYQLNRTQATGFQDFLNNANEIGKKIGLPISSAPLTLTFKKGKFEVAGAKNMPEGIHYDPTNRKYVKIQGGVATIADNYQELISGSQSTSQDKQRSGQTYREFINEKLAEKSKKEAEAEILKGIPSIDASSP